MPLTDLEIRRSKPREKSYTLNDGNGLSLLIEPNGSRGWRFRYRFDGKPKMISLGTYPDVTLNDARRKRDDARRLVAGGINPSDVRKEDKLAKLSRNQNTFEAIAREWYAKRIDRWSESYGEEMMKTFEADVFPFIGQRPIADIKPMELMSVLSKLDERGATEKLRKVRQRCGRCGDTRLLLVELIITRHRIWPARSPLIRKSITLFSPVTNFPNSSVR